MRILLAFDASHHARSALDQIAARPWPRGTEVRVVTVLEEPFALEPPFELKGTGPLVERVRKARRRAARRRLADAVRRLRTSSKLAADSELREGSPKQELLAAIEAWKPDLVFVGSHGRTGLSRVFMGSVSHALFLNAPCSVEVVKILEP